MTREPDDSEFDGITRELESMIFAAKDFVVPSEHFRPAVQEAAIEQAKIRVQEQKIGRIILTLILGSCVCSLAWPGITYLQAKYEPVTSQEIHERAARYASDRYQSYDSGLVDAFVEIKQEQASKLQMQTKEQTPSN